MALCPGELFHHSTNIAASRSVRMAMTSPAPLSGFKARGSVQKLARCSITSRVAMLSDHSWAMLATVGWYLTGARPLATRYSLILVNTVRMAAALLSGTRASVPRASVARVCGEGAAVLFWASSESGAQSGGTEGGSGASGSEVVVTGAVAVAAGGPVPVPEVVCSAEGDTGVISGSTAGASGDPVPVSARAAPPSSSAVPAWPKVTARGPVALAACTAGWFAGGAAYLPAAGDTRASAHNTATTAGAVNFLKTNPSSVQLCQPGDHPAADILRQH